MVLVAEVKVKRLRALWQEKLESKWAFGDFHKLPSFFAYWYFMHLAASLEEKGVISSAFDIVHIIFGSKTLP